MINPDAVKAILDKRLVDVDVHGASIVFRFHDGTEVVCVSDWNEDPATLFAIPLPPTLDFVLYGGHSKVTVVKDQLAQ